MKKRIIVSLLALFMIFLTSATVFAADTKIDFVFSRNVATFQRDRNGKNVPQIPMITISGVTNPSVVKGHSATYVRTHGGDGARLKKSDAPTTQPSLAGTYTIVMKFTDDVPFVCKNGKKTQEYAAAFIIKRAEQAKPVLRSAAPALADNELRTGGTIPVNSQGIVSVAWSSGLKPILTWTAGSDAVVTPEEGKPARFTAKSVGTAILTALLPEDNNYVASESATYTVTVTGSAYTSNFYELTGQFKNQSGWYTSNVTIKGKNGFTKVVSDSAHPISTDGVIDFKFALENESGGKTEYFTVNLKRDATAPVIDNFSINDSPWVDAPEDYEAAWAAEADYVVKLDIFDNASGIAKLEYRVDGSDYIIDENAAFSKEGHASHEFTHTLDNSGHILWIRATDTAGNVAIRDFLVPSIDDMTNSSANSDSNSDNSDSETDKPEMIGVEEITEPTVAMLALTERLLYLTRCNIEAKVIGDVRANQGYIQETLDMFTALSPAERKALGEEDLAKYRAYFEMLYTVQGKDIAEIAPLFVFEVPKPPESESQSKSEAPSSSESLTAAMPESVPSSVSQSNIVASVAPKPEISNNFSPIYLIPMFAAAAAIGVYFIWRKKLAPTTKPFELPTPAPEQEETPFTGFSDPDEY